MGRNIGIMENLNEITRINEQVTGRNMNGVMDKWANNMRAINEAFDGQVDDYKLLTTAILLENTEQFLNQRGRMINEATQPSDVSYFKRYAINLLSAVVPNLIAEDIVSVQPMLSRIGEIRYLRVLYGSDKAPVTKGSQMFGQYQGGDFSQHTYSSDQIEGEGYVGNGTQTKYNLAWTPVIPGSVEVLVDASGDEVVYKDDGNGNLKDGSTTKATINYATGEVTFSSAPDNALTLDFSYEYNNMEVPVDAPEVILRLVTAPIQAKSRKLKTLYSFDAAFDLINDYGMSMNNELITYTAAQIKHEIDMEIINELYTKATGTGVTWNIVAPIGVSLTDHYNSFPSALVEAGNKMFYNTKVASPNFYIVGEQASNVLESLARFKSAGVVDPKGPHLAGWIGEKPVYKSPSIPSDGFLCGFKGSSLFDSGYIYAPYMPIMTTQLLMDETFTGRQGFASSYGKRMTNGDFYAQCKITSNSDVVQIQQING
jgi:hypothetical protein